jgi:hypothetical protein
MYADMSDDQLVIGIRKKFYPDIPMAEFAKRIAYTPIDPTEGMSTGEKLVAGYGKAGADLVRGVGQMVGMVDRADVAESRKLDAPLMKTGAGTAGNVAGNVAALLPTAFIPGAATIPGAAAIGATAGLLQPSTSTRETIQNTAVGGIAAPAAILAGRAVAAGYQGLKALAEPFTAGGRNRIAGQVLNEFAADPAAVAAASGRQGPTITGSAPTLSEASRDTGIATLERALAQGDPRVAAALSQRAADNNAARVGVVQRLAGDDTTRAAAEAARKGASENAYQSATRATYQVDDQLADLLNRPAVKQAMERAKTVAANQGRPFTFDVNPPDLFLGLGNNRVAASKQITGQGLQDLKMALDEMLADPASGFAGKSGDTIKNLRGQIVGWMEKANPEFKAARTAYAEASKPLNAMDVGQRLLGKTTADMKDLAGNDRLLAGKFARALNDERTLVRQATGFKGTNALEDVLDPGQLAGLNAVRDELELAANLASAANGPGSQTAKSFASQNLLRRLLGPTGMPHSWSESALLQTVMRPAQFAMKSAEPKIQNRLAELVLNPEDAAAVMEMARALPLSARVGAAAEPYLPQVGMNALTAAVANRKN